MAVVFAQLMQLIVEFSFRHLLLPWRTFHFNKLDHLVSTAYLFVLMSMTASFRTMLSFFSHVFLFFIYIKQCWIISRANVVWLPDQQIKVLILNVMAVFSLIIIEKKRIIWKMSFLKTKKKKLVKLCRLWAPPSLISALNLKDCFDWQY